MYTDADFRWMRAALAQAERGLWTTTPNPRVGCVLVRDDQLLGAGFTQPVGCDHAEIQALKHARARGQTVAGATAYLTLEPCSHFGRTPPCANALIEAGVTRVVAAMEDPNPLVAGQGLQRLRAAGIAVRCGLLEADARELNLGFVARMTRGRPWVRVKLAASLDGATALADGRSQWITGSAARDDGHRWRARACAVLTGIGTVRADDPQLNVRAVATPRQPLRIVVDPRLELDEQAKLLAGGNALVAVAEHAPLPPGKAERLQARGVEIITLPAIGCRIDLAALLDALGRRAINELHVEAGPTLSGALIAQQLADELLIYLAPSLLGPGRPLCALPALASLDDRHRFAFAQADRVGDDLRLIARRLD